MSQKFDYIDVHGHINFDTFDQDREETIARAQELGVAMINVGTDVHSSLRCVEIASMNENMWATIGVHPTDSKEEIDWSALEQLARHPKTVAIGECGLDYFHSKPDDIPRQKEIFEKHIGLANAVGKPLMLHVRNGRGELKGPAGNAYQDALVILKAQAKVPANFHFFAGSKEDLKNILEAGYQVSFTGVLTFTTDYDELIRNTPLNKIMSETDCPFVAPAPYRGKRNEPSYVIEVIKAIARIRGEEEKVVAGQLVLNAKEFFKI